MSRILVALTRAFRDLMRFKVFWITIWPFLAATTFWLILKALLGDTPSEWITLAFTEIGLQSWLERIAPVWVSDGIESTIQWLLLVPLIIITSLVITAIFAMPSLVNYVSKQYHPDLERKRGGSIGGGILNALMAVGVFIVIWVVTIPTWAFGIGFIVPFIAAAFLNQQLFRYDALAEHANREEIKSLLTTDKLPLWILGLLTGMVQFIPILNIVAPVYAALAFIHFELTCLKNMRSTADSIKQ